MNHSGSILVSHQHRGGSNNGSMSANIVRSKTGQAQTTKTSPHRKQLGTPLDGSISINMQHTSSTNQKLSDFKKGY